ncbi:MAG: serine/threonine protein kinase, partial [Chthonomonadaceae bacterium]|nr:serine/threonine protein kinase [Chthonomonadaceae bacterium]
EDGTIKLMDFGLARLLTANSRSQASLLAGTLAYMAPEQLKGGKSDGRADLYSLGILFYEYLAGVTPFEADNPGAILMKHLTETAPPLRNYVPDIAPEFERVVLRLLEKEPTARFESATALREALESPMVENALPLVCAADRSLPGAKIYTVPAIHTVEAPTPVMPVQTAVPPKPASFLQRHTTSRVQPVFLMGGVACFSVATLLSVGPIHRRMVAANGAEAGRIAKKASAPAATSGSLVQQANPVPAPSQGAARSNDQNRIESSQAHASAELDELIKQQEQTRTEVERLEKLVAASETKRKAAESRASAAEAAFAGRTITGTRLTPRQKAQLNPLPPALPETLLQIAALHPHDQFEFRTKPITRTPDGTIQVQVHNSRACYVYFYLLQENKNQAMLLPNGERRLSGTPQLDVFTAIGLRLDEPGTVPVKLLLLASVKPLNGLPASFPLPNLPKRSPDDVAIDRRFALLHDYRDQIVSTMQANRVLLDGKNLQQDDLIVRFLRYKPATFGAPPAGPPPLLRKLRQNGSTVTGTGTPQIASIPYRLIPIESFGSKDAL